MLCRFLLMVFLSVVCTSAGAMPGDPPADGAHVSPALAGRVLKLVVHAKALEGNRLGDPAGRSLIVYLPPSYDHAPRRRYPVIYLLGGYAAVPALASEPGYGPVDLIVAPIDRAIASGRLGELIVVDIKGYNRLGGSFWVNSSTTGRWEDLVMQDVLHAIDSRYRTIPRRSGRGLGARDLRHILVGAPAFDRALTAHGVHHEFEVDHGGHVAFDRVGRDAIPFFARTLEGARATAPLSGGGG